GQMRRYLLLRVIVTTLLYAGLLGTLVSALTQLAPATSQLARAFDGFAAIAGALTGLLTLTYLALSRLVTQCQMDIIGHFMLGMPLRE
ncbi:MAG TPA: hypothetical protein VFH47_05050, partial [Candidatus Thermoplasmatota archaeon]|nr:hypothetical protein [Candidatus Thermoplasmatota archaeon]